MSYEVWAKDRYNRYEILTVLNTGGRPENEWATPEEALAAAKRYVHDKNLNNSLTYDEQKRGATHALPLLADEIYAGDLIMARHMSISKTASADRAEVRIDPIEDKQFSFYMGNNPEGGEWLLEDPRRRPVTTLDNTLIQDKTIVFVHAQR